MSERKTDDATLIAAVRILARTIKSDDGAIPARLAEVATRLEELVEERRWVPVGERLPDKFRRLLLFDPTIPNFPRTNTHVVIGHFRGLDDLIFPWHCPNGRGPTHWMPLPEGPEPKEDCDVPLQK